MYLLVRPRRPLHAARSGGLDAKLLIVLVLRHVARLPDIRSVLGLRSLVGIHVAELGDGVALDAPVLELHQRVLGAAVADLANDLLICDSLAHLQLELWPKLKLKNELEL